MKKWIGLALAAGLIRAVAPDVVVTEAIVNAPVGEVWKAFTTKEGIESWMVAKAEIDLRVGGVWRTSYSKDSSLRDDASIEQTILSLDPGHMISIRTVRPPKGFPFPDHIVKAWTVIYFEPAGNLTKVTARMYGFTDDPDSQKMRAFFERGNASELNSLVKKFAGPPR